MPAKRIARRVLPHPDALSRTRGLAWLGHYLAPRPWLWVAHRRRVAWGAAIGLAAGVVPLPTQMLMAALLAIVLRGNVAAAVAATWLTNPFTLLPIWSLAIALGRWVLGPTAGSATTGDPPAAPAQLEIDWAAPNGWLDALSAWLGSLGKPLLVGLPLTGLLLGGLLYLLVYYGWWAVIRGERWRRLRRRR